MPIYEYVCKACGKESERLQKMADAPLTDCPDCGEPKLKKKISAAGFRLKGAGWYETDFKGKNKKYGTQNNESTTGSKKSDSAKKSAESKPAKKAAVKAK